MKSKIIAAAWGPDESLAVLQVRGKTREVVVTRGGHVERVVAAVAAATRVVLLDDGSVLTANNDGGTRWVTADDDVADDLERHVADLVVANGVAWAPGSPRCLAKWDTKKGTWVGTGLAEKLDELLEEHDESVGDVHSLVAGRRGPIAAVRLENYRKNLLLEHDGKQWRERARLDFRVNAIAWRASTDTVFAVGDDLHAVNAKGRATRIPNPRDDERNYWSAAWVNERLLAGTLDGVDAIDVRSGRATAVLAASRGEVPHNHSLAASETEAAFVRDGSIFTLRGARMALWKPPK